jgi:hypothetical protein
VATILDALERDPGLIDPVYKRLQKIQTDQVVRAANAGAAVVTKVGNTAVMRLARTDDGPMIKDGNPVWQRVQGRKWEGASMVAFTRSAIAEYDADPLDVTAAVIDNLPPEPKTDCTKYAATTPERVSEAIARLLPDEGFRSVMIERRLACYDANPNVEQIKDTAAHDRRSSSCWRGNRDDLEKLEADLDRVDEENAELLKERQWKALPEELLRAILRELGHPKPDNVTRHSKSDPEVWY